MLLAIKSPRELLEAPMTLGASWPDSPGIYSVKVDGALAGAIRKEMWTGGRTVWMWSLTGPVCVNHAGLCINDRGAADSLEEAKREFKAAFHRWAHWAEGEIAAGRPARWHGPPAGKSVLT